MNRKAIAAMLLAVSGTVASCGSSTNNTTSSSGGGGGPSASSVKICILSEFRTRPDGLLGLESKYNAAFSKATYTDIGNTAEKTIANGQCTAGEVFTTDSAIQANNLYVLQDDKNLFPPDNAGPGGRAPACCRQYPAIANLMAPVAAKLDIATMVSLNGMVEIQNMKVADVAKTWLTQNGFLASSYTGGGGTNGSGTGCATASGSDGGGAHVSVGVKGFAEEQLLGAMTKLVLEAHNFVVDDTFQAKDKALGPGADRRLGRHDLAVHRHRAHRLPRPRHRVLPDGARRGLQLRRPEGRAQRAVLDVGDQVHRHQRRGHQGGGPRHLRRHAVGVRRLPGVALAGRGRATGSSVAATREEPVARPTLYSAAMATERSPKQIASKSEDFDRWYVDVVRRAELADYTPVRGCMVIRPYGYALWERTRDALDAMFKRTGAREHVLPAADPGERPRQGGRARRGLRARGVLGDPRRQPRARGAAGDPADQRGDHLHAVRRLDPLLARPPRADQPVGAT